MSVEHMHPVRGLQGRSGHARQVIKEAWMCQNCKHSYTIVKQGLTYMKRHACNLHNCEVQATERCKHHKHKETARG